MIRLLDGRKFFLIILIILENLKSKIIWKEWELGGFIGGLEWRKCERGMWTNGRVNRLVEYNTIVW